ncbi:MAG: hypothetical protein AAF657_09615 [Acidobacteriota bacterium]
MKRILWTLVLLGLVAPIAWADSKEALRLGVEALESSRWADAERFFRAAMAERSQERVNRLLKINYLPHYYLGIALAEQGRCRSALDAWNESERQGQVRKSRLTGDLDQRIEGCQSHLQQVARAAEEVEDLLETVAASADSLAALGKTSELANQWNQGEPSFAARQGEAQARLSEAKKLLGQGRDKDDLDLLDASKTQARQAMTELESTITAARQSLGDLNAATDAAREQLEQAAESARRVLRSIRDLAPFPKGLTARVAAVESQLGKITENLPTAGANRLDTLRDELTVSLAALRRAARRPPETLTRAAEAYFNGAYDSVLELTEEVAYARDSRARSHRCLLRSGARYALWVLGGEQDEPLLELAGEEIRSCLEIDPPLPPNPKFYPPRFVEFHAATLEAIARAAEEALAEEALAEEALADDAVADEPEPGAPAASAEPAQAGDGG